jgi:acetyl-CoA C-acetyltransferase
MAGQDRIVIVDGARTPIGSFGGVLKDVPAHELGAAAVREALVRAGVEATDIESIVMGCIGQVGPDAYNARRVGVAAGLPMATPALTVNRLCGSGLQAIWSAAQEMRWNGLGLAVAGGDESMSRMPFYDFGARAGYRLGDRPLVDSGRHMGITAENVAAKYGVSRAEQDEFALRSQQLAATEAARAAFAEEIVPVTLPGRRPVVVETDQHPKPETTLEVLGGLRAAFQEGGSVTAGNASGINDGAAAVVLAQEAVVQERGLTGLVTLEAVATAAMEPELMGYAPTPALAALWKRTGLSPKDIGTFEVNEAFASQAVAVVRDAGLDLDRVNPYGGAIALGHPVGATGAILTLRAAKDMVRRDLEFGVVTMCIGGGQALAALLKRY